MIALVLLSLPSCRVPDPPVIKDKSLGLQYDTSMEEEIRSGKAPSIVVTAYERYIDTLAEPVAITAWTDSICRWEVFVATNRGRFTATDRRKADNLVLETVSYGRSEVLLPRQVRGKDPKMTPTKKPLVALPGFGKRSLKDELVATADSEGLSKSEFLDGINAQLNRSRHQDLLVFVHGFNVSFDSAVIRTAQVALDMPFNGAVVAYCWPSQGGVFSYDEDEPINQASVVPFMQFLQTLKAGVPPETKINIVVHSMGNRIVMEALSRIAAESNGEKLFANVALCAPDVGHADFQQWAPGVVAVTERVTLYSSSGDAALIASEGLHGERRAGDAWEPETAPGIETIDCSRVDLTFMGHSYYGSNTEVLSDLFMLLKEGKRAAKRPHLTAMTTDAGEPYFQFSKSAPEFRVGWHFEDLESTVTR